jgi:hypothetical protein
MQADHLAGMPVLLSFAIAGRQKWIRDYAPTFGRILIDSGAFSELNTGKRIDLVEYGWWLEGQRDRADAAVGLDSIAGDWQQSLANWDALPHTFPTLHDSDPPEYIEAVIERLQEPHRARLRATDRQWVGIGLVPPRRNTRFVLDMLTRIPPGIHVHCFALRGLAPEVLARRGPDVSFDSTNWLLDSHGLRVRKGLGWLTPAECVELVVKRYQRVAPKAARLKPKQGELL